MTTREAIETLRRGGRSVDLAKAIAVLVSDPSTMPRDLLLGLQHPGFVAEQAAFALYRLTNTTALLFVMAILKA